MKMPTDLNQVPEGHGDEPRIHLPANVLEFIAQRPNPPSFNGYKCERRPRHIIVTIDIHPGVTPMFLGCKDQHCDAMMSSMGYPNNGAGPVPEHLWPAPAFEWYRPNMEEFIKLPARVSDHVMQGGLLLRATGKTFTVWYEEQAGKQEVLDKLAELGGPKDAPQ